MFDMANPGCCTNMYKKNEKNGYLKQPINISLFSDWFSRNNEIYGNDTSGIEKAKCLIRDFVRLYRTICYIRNNANHSNNELGIETIKRNIDELNKVLKTIKQQTLSGANYSFYTDSNFT